MEIDSSSVAAATVWTFASLATAWMTPPTPFSKLSAGRRMDVRFSSSVRAAIASQQRDHDGRPTVDSRPAHASHARALLRADHPQPLLRHVKGYGRSFASS
jgi:hypothetical protein